MIGRLPQLHLSLCAAFYWLLTLAAPVSAAPVPSCEELLDSGDACYDRFNNTCALAHFQGAHQACPEDYAGLMKTSRALTDVGEDSTSSASESLFVLGARYADTLEQRFPDSGQSYFLRAVAIGNIASIRNGVRKVAMVRNIQSDILRSIAKDSTFAPAYIVLGRYYREVALANPFLKAIARIFLGGVPKGTLLDSQTALRKALMISPQNVYARLELARTKEAMHDRKGAIELLKSMQNLPRVWHMDDRLKEMGRAMLTKLDE